MASWLADSGEEAEHGAPLADPDPADDEQLLVGIELVDRAVRGIFSTSLRLASARAMTEGLASARLGEAIDELDELVRELRSSAWRTRVSGGPRARSEPSPAPPAVGPAPAVAAVLDATRALLRIDDAAEARDVTIDLVAELGGAVTDSVDEARPGTPPIDLSFGVGPVLVAVAEPTSVGRMLLERHLPAFVEDAHRAVAHARGGREAAREVQRRSVLRAEVAALLNTSEDGTGFLEELCDLLAHGLGEWCAIELLDEAVDGQLHVAHQDPEREQSLRSALSHTSVRSLLGVEDRTQRDGSAPVQVSFDDGDALRRTERHRLPGSLGVTTAMVVPVVGSSGTLGHLTVGGGHDDPYDAEDVAVGVWVAGRLARALDLASGNERTRRAAVTLQRGLLPPVLPSGGDLATAARVLPAARGDGVGVDWFDAFALSDGRLCVTVGDTAGHRLEDAVVMGQVRAALRAYMVTGAPGDALTHLDALSGTVPGHLLSTAVAVSVDPAADRIEWASAGHLPPLLLTDGDGAFLPSPTGPPIGSGGCSATRRADFRPGSTLVLYTDGLVRRRGEHLDVGLARLRRACLNGPSEPDALVDHLLAAMSPGEPDDDTALLVVSRQAREVRGDVRS